MTVLLFLFKRNLSSLFSVKMNKNHKNKSLLKRLLKHNLRITSRNMKPHDFQLLDLILNNLNTFIINSPQAEITDNIIRLRGNLERLVGVQYRSPTIYNVSIEVAANNVYNLGFLVLKQHLSKASEIEEIWKLIELSFSKPPSPPELFICARSSTSPSSLSDFSETEPESPHNVNPLSNQGSPSTSKEAISAAVKKEVERTESPRSEENVGSQSPQPSTSNDELDADI